jgi:hypothetical protein
VIRLPPLFVVVARGGQFGCHLMFFNTGGIFYGDYVAAWQDNL